MCARRALVATGAHDASGIRRQYQEREQELDQELELELEQELDQEPELEQELEQEQEQMNGFEPGWADRFGKAVCASHTEEERSEVTGLRPRKAWRRNSDVNQTSRIRGANARGKRKLPKLEFPEDE